MISALDARHRNYTKTIYKQYEIIIEIGIWRRRKNVGPGFRGCPTVGEYLKAFRQLAAASAVYAFPVSGFSFSNTGFQRETGNQKRETRKRQRAAALRRRPAGAKSMRH
jgi:hypothetical protein